MIHVVEAIETITFETLPLTKVSPAIIPEVDAIATVATPTAAVCSNACLNYNSSFCRVTLNIILSIITINNCIFW